MHMTRPAMPEAAAELADANRILYDQGVVDAFGHVSLRDPARPDRFWLSRSKAPSLVVPEDLMCFDFDGRSEGDDRRPYLERFIHGEIYRARPDVMAVVHSHSPAVIPFGLVDAPFRPVCHMCGFLGGRTPVFEIRECAGLGSDLLVRNGALGAALAGCLAGGTVALMRGHGVTVVGTGLRQAVFRAVYTEFNAKIQATALGLGGTVTYLTDAEADAAAAANDSQIDRAWDMWKLNAAGG